MPLINALLNNHVMKDPDEEKEVVAQKRNEATTEMRHLKAHLDVIAVGLIIVVSLYKIYDLSKK